MSDLSIEIKVPDSPLFKGPGPAGEICQKHMRAATEAGLATLRAAVLPHTPVDRGMLRGGVQTSLSVTQADVLGRIFNPLAHANPMETGTKAFFPPTAPLVGWVQRVLGVSPKEAKGVAFLVARSIARKGIAARRMFGKGFDESKGAVMKGFDDALSRIARELGGGR